MSNAAIDRLAALASAPPAPAASKSRKPLSNAEIYEDYWLPIHRNSEDQYKEIIDFAHAILAADRAPAASIGQSSMESEKPYGPINLMPPSTQPLRESTMADDVKIPPLPDGDSQNELPYRQAWTADQMRAFYLQGYNDGSAQRALAYLTDAARDILAERHRQISAEGWTPEHDDHHSHGELAIAAACYASNAGTWQQRGTDDLRKTYADLSPGSRWPWLMKWWKPTNERRDLVKAGALILAEIERLDRAAIKGEQP